MRTCESPDGCSADVSSIWDTCLCGKRICFPHVRRRVVGESVEVRCGYGCERPGYTNAKQGPGIVIGGPIMHRT